LNDFEWTSEESSEPAVRVIKLFWSGKGNLERAKDN
jgi:hypothetical protein